METTPELEQLTAEIKSYLDSGRKAKRELDAFINELLKEKKLLDAFFGEDDDKNVKDVVMVKVYEYLTLKEKISALYVKARDDDEIDEVYVIRDGKKILVRSFESDGCEGSEMAYDYVNQLGNKYPNLTKLENAFVDLAKVMEVTVEENDYDFLPYESKVVAICHGHKIEIEFFEKEEDAEKYADELWEKVQDAERK